MYSIVDTILSLNILSQISVFINCWIVYELVAGLEIFDTITPIILAIYEPHWRVIDVIRCDAKMFNILLFDRTIVNKQNKWRNTS